MHLEKDAVALERPDPVHCAVFALYLLACGLGALCIPRILLLIELFRDQLCSWSQFLPGHPWSVLIHPRFPV